jgi:hypothetical protein
MDGIGPHHGLQAFGDLAGIAGVGHTDETAKPAAVRAIDCATASAKRGAIGLAAQSAVTFVAQDAIAMAV